MNDGITRVGAYALCREGDRVLLTRIAAGQDDPGSWTLPGGGLEFGEPPEVGVLRELAEETGLEGEVVALAGVDSWHGVVERRAGPVEQYAVRILYHVKIVGGELRDEVGGSSDRSAWVGLDEAGQLPLVDLATLGLDLLPRP